MPNEKIFNNNIYTLIRQYGLNINPVKIKKAIILNNIFLLMRENTTRGREQWAG